MLVFSDGFAGSQVSNGTFVFMPTLFLIIFCFILIFYVCFASLCLREGQISRFAMSDFLFLFFWFCCNALFLLAFFCILPQNFVCFISVLYFALFLEDVTAFSSFVYFVLYWSLLGLAAERRRSEGWIFVCMLNYYSNYYTYCCYFRLHRPGIATIFISFSCNIATISMLTSFDFDVIATIILLARDLLLIYCYNAICICSKQQV